jgi:nucleoside-diphosphate-sugar epimerase
VADDPTRARDELGWKATVDVMDWIREFKNGG